MFDKFKKEIRGLKIGARKQYHRGSLAIARDHNFELDQVSELLYRLQELGYVKLYQQKDVEGVTCYWFLVSERITRERLDEAVRLR